MNKARLTSTERRALLDSEKGARGAFAKRTVSWALNHGHDRVIWHFPSKNEVERILRDDPRLRRLVPPLKSKGKTSIDGVEILLATPRRDVPYEVPMAVWMATDKALLNLDSTRLPLLDALVSKTHRAPVWLTAFRIDVGAEVGAKDPNADVILEPDKVVSVEPPDHVQKMVSQHSGIMNLGNGVHDSCADLLVRDSRKLIRRDDATPQSIAVAALRARWWPEQVPDLMKKLGG